MPTEKRKPGRPKTNPEGAQRVNVILFPDELARLEEWADSVEGITGRRPGRSELIRRVIECSGDAPAETLCGDELIVQGRDNV